MQVSIARIELLFHVIVLYVLSLMMNDYIIHHLTAMFLRKGYLNQHQPK